jgi:hypothetical protein
MKVAVIGAGAFGCTIAVKLAEQGFNVSLFESNTDIVQGASALNQYRIHRGYHYPRSLDTALETKHSTEMFIQAFPECIVRKNRHYYSIAAEGSLISPSAYLDFCKRVGLKYKSIITPNYLRSEKVALTIEAEEYLYDPNIFRELLRKQLQKNSVKVIYKDATKVDLSIYDQVIAATYSANNRILELFGEEPQEFQYELCEKLLVKLPTQYQNNSIVIMDGPFMCADPYGHTDYHVLGNVVKAIHSDYTGILPTWDKLLAKYLNKGLIVDPEASNFSQIIEHGNEFMHGFNEAKHIASMYTVRAVLPYRDYDDARPSLVTRVNEKLISVFSGKVNTCVDVSNRILELLVNNKVAEQSYR